VIIILINDGFKMVNSKVMAIKRGSKAYFGQNMLKYPSTSEGISFLSRNAAQKRGDTFVRDTTTGTV
jgi:hypothetical protein